MMLLPSLPCRRFFTRLTRSCKCNAFLMEIEISFLTYEVASIGKYSFTSLKENNIHCNS
ncbi:unnamed protein product [Linum tenue]|uniref:Uncharacterized protein n=1 Tax=Linum tenue TaxID=586396 RepID=A0AAV0J3H6_9ROSI|nr:unnamed protein product [Linum tenue]